MRSGFSWLAWCACALAVSACGVVNAQMPMPSIAAVTLPSDGVYTATPGRNVPRFAIDYTQVVTVNDPWYSKALSDGSGTPTLPIELDGGRIVQARLSGGSITRTLTFEYTIASGDAALHGIALGAALQMNGGTITNGVGDNAIETLSGHGSTAAIVVDAAAGSSSVADTPLLSIRAPMLLACEFAAVAVGARLRWRSRDTAKTMRS